MAELLDGIRDRSITEVFACGTAAVITPIGQFRHESGEDLVVADGEVGEHTGALRQQLLDIQYGRANDDHGWLTRVC
jgi:branched-chain amino acid aminotransferase